MIKPEGKRNVAVEDLLQLKRAERPPSDFWGRFERELRAKQLSALLVRRPWWHRLPSVAPFLVRHRILIGASGVLAMSLMSLQSSRSPGPAVANQLVAADAALGTASASDFIPTPESHDPLAAVERPMPVRALVEPSREGFSAGGVNFAVPAAVRTTAVVEQPLHPDSVPTVMPPSISHIVAADLALSVPVDAVTLRTKFAGRSAAHVVATRTTVEPLQQMTPPSETRRTRLLTAMVSMTSLEAPNRAT
ncbi:MAG: hypothetical protein ABIQ12_13860, partial [Opitutaceae bacterium]